MCGIAGILTTTPAGDEPSRLQAMHRAIAHRGPDDAGVWRSTSGNAGFCHTRLSILDLSPAGRQPMSSADGRLVITYNGEIYNFLELRRSLEQRGARFRTRTDTEVILRAYEADGPACVESFRGMFAFALWDDREQACLLARDPFGIKPLYYHATPTRLVFGSEVRTLLASGLVTPALDAEAMCAYFQAGSVPEPRTLLRDVRSVEAGHYAWWRQGELGSRRYWSMAFDPSAQTAQEAAARTREALVDSVRHHFISDVPVGVFLSGGVDSTALVALAKAAGIGDLHTFSIAFPGRPEDEGPLASRSAAHFGTTHHEWAVDGAAAKDLFTAFLKAADQPSIDGLNTFAVSRFARDLNMKVVLSGLGSDELFGGYKSFQQVPRLADWHRRVAATGALGRAAAAVAERLAPGPRTRRVAELLGQPPSLSHAYAAFRGVFTRAEAARLTEKYTGVPPPECLAREPDSDPSPTPGDAVSRMELTRYMRNQLLRDADTMSMASGLELRVPFLDCRLADTLGAIPADLRLRPPKQLLLDAVPEVPAWIRSQPKRGFLFPMEHWLGGEWREVFTGIDRTSPVPTGTWYRKWCVFVLEQWVDRMSRDCHD